MPQMERNVDLEKIDSDTLFGIEALRHQSIGQKILFYGCLAGGVLSNTLMPKLLHTTGIINVFAFTAFLMIGIAGGCNYTQDISYGRYLCLRLFGKKKHLSYRPGVKLPGKTAPENEPDPKEQKRIIKKAVLLILLLSMMMGAIFIVRMQREKAGYHHEIERSIHE